MIKIVAVTSTRADYGLLSSLLEVIRDDTNFDLRLVVTGTHLSAKYGMTVNEIQNDGFTVHCKIKINLCVDTPVALTISAANLTQKIAKTLDSIKPDAILILGDRFEILTVAYAAAIQSIPVIHIHGGELTLGAIDNKMRFAISHLADYHLTATEKSRQRLIDIGISSRHAVFTGGIGVENALNVSKFIRQEIEVKTGWQFREKNILFTFHPETISKLDTRQQIDRVLDGLEKFQEAAKFITMPNVDPGNRTILERIRAFIKHQPNTYFIESLGHKLYLSVMNEVDVVVGNSSSGIIEAPALGIPTVNIGERQSGREQASSIIQCGFDAEDIRNSIRQALIKTSALSLSRHPYYHQHTSKSMVMAIKSFLT